MGNNIGVNLFWQAHTCAVVFVNMLPVLCIVLPCPSLPEVLYSTLVSLCEGGRATYSPQDLILTKKGTKARGLTSEQLIGEGGDLSASVQTCMASKPTGKFN